MVLNHRVRLSLTSTWRNTAGARSERVKQATVIVTGASQGLGAAIASAAADQGAQVVMTARSEAALELHAQKIRQRGGNAFPIVGDVTRFEDCQRIIDGTLKSFGRFDALINNAATIEPIAPIVEAHAEDWAHHMAVNLFGPMMMSQRAIPHLRQTSGRLVNVTSQGAELAISGFSAYSTSKAALNRFSKVLAVEEPAITVILFIPGDVDTPMQGVIRDKSKGKTSDEMHQLCVDLYEQGKLLPPETPALAAVSLALKAPLAWSGEILEWEDKRVQELVGLL
jgi:NAD(P)-dependent dehydrogenase (short-subunit alcohol dehydrogenase family)